MGNYYLKARNPNNGTRNKPPTPVKHPADHKASNKTRTIPQLAEERSLLKAVTKQRSEDRD
jgi:hypothetical protein